jgi:phage RecT family recombinase
MAAMMAASLDLPINSNLGHSFIIPYNTKQKDGSYKQMAQYIIGYKGFIQLAQRSGQFLTISAKPVYEGQFIETDSFEGFSFNWKNKQSEKIVGYAETLKNTNNVSIDDATSKLIDAVINLKEGRKQFAQEAEAIVKTAVSNTTETVKVANEADTVTNNLPI